MAIQAGKAVVHFKVLQEMGVLFSAHGEPRPEVLCAPASLPDDVAYGTADAPPRHVFSSHTPLWAYERPSFAMPVPGGAPLFELLDPASTLDEVLARTRFVAVIGAELSPELARLLDEPGVLVLIFEHDAARLGRFLGRIEPARLANKALVFLGRPHEFLPPLSGILVKDTFSIGFPVFFLPQAASEADAAYALEVAEYVETLFYRFVMYPLSGQALSQGLPLRAITRDRFYDQLVHAYENIPAYALCPDIGSLKGLFRGETAIVAAAGASLAEQYGYLRENQDRAVIITVNSALKSLVAAGIRPHFCVVNDTSLQVAKSFEGLPLLRPVMLVAHSLSALGGDVFPQKFLFGQMRTDVFGPRPSLRLHGSVLTTALALARYLGCDRAVLAGALLSSGDPWSLGYVTGSTGRGYEPESRERIDRFPQLYPVTNRFGRQRYTSLNFLDVKHWLGDELRQGGLEVVNTSKDSILDIPPVRFDAAPAIEPTGRLAQALRTAHAARRRAPALNAALGYARAEYARHAACLDLLDSLEGLDDPAFLVQGSKVLAVFDGNNVTYLLQRYEDFSHTQFYAWITSPDPADRLRGLRYQFAYARRMLASLLELLRAQERRLLQLGASG
ncbi:MAG: 6-hydroxymethylpterin diphosphokinase MptE-like protein [Desulfovibrio sp.]